MNAPIKWKYFGAACVFAGYLMHALGASWYAVAAGIGLAVTWKAWKKNERRA